MPHGIVDWAAHFWGFRKKSRPPGPKEITRYTRQTKRGDINLPSTRQAEVQISWIASRSF